MRQSHQDVRGESLGRSGHAPEGDPQAPTGQPRAGRGAPPPADRGAGGADSGPAEPHPGEPAGECSCPASGRAGPTVREGRMKLKRWDWDAQNYVEIEYPDGPIKAYIDWLNNTKAWIDDVELVHRRLRKMNAELEIARSGATVMGADDALPRPAETLEQKFQKVKKPAKKPRTQAQLDALARGRAALEAKRAAKVAP